MFEGTSFDSARPNSIGPTTSVPASSSTIWLTGSRIQRGTPQRVGMVTKNTHLVSSSLDVHLDIALQMWKQLNTSETNLGSASDFKLHLFRLRGGIVQRPASCLHTDRLAKLPRLSRPEWAKGRREATESPKTQRPEKKPKQ